MLAAAVRAALDYTDASVDGLIDEAADAFRARSDPDSEVVAVALGTVAAQSRCDIGRLLSIAGRALSIPGGEGHPVVRLAGRTSTRWSRRCAGEPEIALRAFDEAPLDDVPTSLALAANRFRMHCLLLAGRADEAVAVADESLAVGGMGNRHAQLMPAVARWQAGDPGGFLGSDRNEAVDEHGEAAAMTAGASSRDAFVAAALRAVILASIGQLDRQALRLDGTVGFDNPRDAALISNARAAGAVVDGDEAAAARFFEDFLARHPVGDAVGDAGRLGERHLRRFVALGYVLNRDLRARWDTVPLGPAHAWARDVARALLAVRAGGRPHTVVPAVVLTVLPLPWSVELACRLHGLGSVDGMALAGWLVDHVGRAVREELRRTSVSTDAALARGATALLSCLPIEPTGAAGDLRARTARRLRADGQRVTRAELRRAGRARALSVLVVERSVTRERAMDVLWPDFDADVAARNLRVTLTDLRRLLEPERPPGEAGFHLRVDSTTIQLFASPKLLVDLWEMTALRASAAAARTSGDIDRAIELYDAASTLLRGAPLVDVGRLAGFDDEIERARLSHVSALLGAGELRFAQGAARQAASDAERALAVDPCLERAHRLAIAAHLHGHQPGRAAAAVARAQNALDELGVDPEPATAMLMRQAAAWPPAGPGVARAS